MATESLTELVRLKPNVYGFRYHTHVALFIPTDEGVILIDPCGEANPRTPYLVKESVRAITEQPVRHLIYSHWGADHGMGAAAFHDTATIYGHRNSVEKIEALNDQASPVPDVVFDKQWALDFGGVHLDIYPTNLSDTDDYVVIHYPEARLAMLVDIVQPVTGALQTLMGHPERIIERLRWLHDSVDFDLLISGHSTPHMECTKQDVEDLHGFYIDLLAAIDAASKAGLGDASPEMIESVQNALRPKYGTWRRFIQLDSNIRGVFGWRNGTITRRP